MDRTCGWRGTTRAPRMGGGAVYARPRAARPVSGEHDAARAQDADLQPICHAGSPARAMKRAQLEDLLRRLAPLVGRAEVTMIGSQCVHAVTDDPAAEVLMSVEVDILLESHDP